MFSKSIILKGVLFSFLVILTLSTYKDYGISSDEISQHKLGEYSYKYVAEDDQTYTWYADNDYGVATEMPLYFIVDILMGEEDSKEVFQNRHLVLHILFLIAVLVFFLLVNKLFKNQLLAFLGSLMLLLHPRIYAHSFFNSKDLPLLSFTIIGLYILFRFIDNRKFVWLIFLAVISALIINNRIIGIMFFTLVCGSFIITFVYENSLRKSTLKQGVLFLIMSFTVLYITWPILWDSPFHQLGIIFNNMAHFRWEDFVLFKGEIINATKLPWNYIPYWFVITTPIIILVLGFTGLISALIYSSRNIKNLNQDKVKYFVFLNTGLFLAPIIAVITLNSVLYDGWRHLYFIYPSFIILGLYFLHQLNGRFSPKKISNILYGFIILILCLESGIFMVRNHPNHQVYFNAFVNKNEKLNSKMELDYWGLSYRGALEYILEKDDNRQIKIAYETGVCKKNASILPSLNRSRLSFTKDIDSADYFITNYRWHMKKDSSFSQTINYPPIYDLKVGNTSIMTAWKLHE